MPDGMVEVLMEELGVETDGRVGVSGCAVMSRSTLERHGFKLPTFGAGIGRISGSG
jgi:hypothetical protein